MVLNRTEQSVKRNINTVIVEPGTFLREGLASLLQDSEFRVVSAVESLDKVRPEALGRANLLIVGASCGTARALDYLRQISASAQKLKIIVFKEASGRVTQPEITGFLCNGAEGCILNVRSRDILLKSLHLVLLNQRVVILGEDGAFPDVTEHQECAAPSTAPDAPISGDVRLSDREMEILSRIAAGESNKLIARSCQLAESTVKIHLRAILRKIRVRNRTQAAIWAIQNADRHELHDEGDRQQLRVT